MKRRFLRVPRLFPDRARNGRTGATETRDGPPRGGESSSTADLVPNRNTPRIREFGPRRRELTTAAGVRSNRSYHQRALKLHMDRAIDAGARVGGKRERPPDDDVVKLNDYKAAALLEGMDNSLRAAMTRGLMPRIKGLIYRKKVYEKALRLYRSKVRAKRQKMSSKVMAAVTLGATSGSVRAFKSIRRLERVITGQPSALRVITGQPSARDHGPAVRAASGLGGGGGGQNHLGGLSGGPPPDAAARRPHG